MERRYPLHVHISTLFLALILLVGGLIAYTSYRYASDMIENAAADLAQRVGRETLSEINRLLAPAEMAVGTLSYHPLAAAGTLGARMAHLELMSAVLNESAALSSVYFGYPGGDFFFMRRLSNDADRATLKAPPGTEYLVQSIERGEGGERGSWLFLGAALQVLRQDDRPDYPAAYDPRKRGWYNDALGAPGLIRTAPYVFFSDRKVGMTLAMRANTGYGVVAADIRLETLSASVARQKVTPATQIALVNSAGLVVAHEDVARLASVSADADARPQLVRVEDFGIPVLARLASTVRGMDSGASVRQRIEVDGVHWRAKVVPVVIEGTRPLYLVMAIPENELLAAAIRMRNVSLLITALIIALAVPVTWFFARAIARPLRALETEADAIRHFEFSKPIAVRSMISEVDALAMTMGDMKRSIRRFLDISGTVAAETDFDRLLPAMLSEMLAVSGAGAGVLYLADDEGLLPVAARSVEGNDLLQGLPRLEKEGRGPLLSDALRAGTVRSGAMQEGDHACFRGGGAWAGVAATHALAVPLVNRQRQLVGALLLLRTTEVEAAHESFVQAISGTVAGVLETRELISAQKALFEAFIQMIAGAIDAKSPYTGGHCARVPELTKMLARAACAETRGPFADFSLDDSQWEAVHVASWLHDCGKITTPEFVVDKATKLETLYDRIHEVRMRFEVLKRDAEIACLQAIAAGEPADTARARRDAELRRLNDDFAFVAACNEGGEYLAPEKVERLKAIGGRTWTRTLDDRLGISYEERQRKARVPAPKLPVAEPLLADRPEHRIERRAQDRIAENNRWGFRMAVPELLYNRGELHNLSVARGTLSEEERYKINEHIVQTLIMLNQLPFPKHLREVPEIAGGHHEKMDGTGYPKRLTRDEMSPVARMMAIADIFEALTAADRPYKKAKPLSEAIRIMSAMKRDSHIDPQLFDLFLSSGVYRDYAQRFLSPEQIDDVNVAQYLSPAA